MDAISPANADAVGGTIGNTNTLAEDATLPDAYNAEDDGRGEKEPGEYRQELRVYWEPASVVISLAGWL